MESMRETRVMMMKDYSTVDWTLIDKQLDALKDAGIPAMVAYGAIHTTAQGILIIDLVSIEESK